MLRETLLVRALVELADTLVDDFDVIDLLTTLSNRCVSILDVDAAGVMLANRREQLEVVASSSDAMRILELFELQASEGPCVDAYRTATPIVNQELSAASGRWPNFVPRALEAGVHSVHSLPMRHRGRTVGALNLFRTHNGLLAPDDVSAAQALADMATIAIVQNHVAAEVLTVRVERAETLNNRVIIEQATGIVSQAAGISTDEAFEKLLQHAQHHSIRLGDLCRGVAEKTIHPGSLDSDPSLGP